MAALERWTGELEPIGKLLARLRQARGWSQLRLAEKLCDAARMPTVSRHEVSRWEREERIPGSFWLHWLAVVLDAPLDQLEVAVAATRGRAANCSARHAGQQRVWRPQAAADLLAALDHARGDDIPILAHAWLAEPTDASNAPPPLSRELFRAADRAAPEALSALESRLAERRQQDDVVGGLDLAEHINRELRSAVAVLRTTHGGETRRRAWRLVAGYAQLAGWTHADAGDGPAARRSYRVALQAAAEAGDRSLAAHALGSLSHHSLATGDLREALLLAQTGYAGLRTDGGAGAMIRALLLHRVALAAARAGDRREAVGALLGAEKAAEHARHEREPEWLYWLDAEELSAMTGRCLAALGRPLRAAHLLGHVRRRLAPRPRTTALYAIWLARCYIELGEVEQACQVGAAALTDVVAAGSARAAAGLRHLHPLLLRHRDVPAVQRYERLADAAAGHLYDARPRRRGFAPAAPAHDQDERA